MNVMRPLIASVIIILAVAPAYAAIDNPHDFTEVQCRRCHLDPSGHPKALRTSVARMCKECHRDIMRRPAHPLNRQAGSVRVPRDLPLKNGRITCNTCHDVHGTRFTSPGTKSYFLRRQVTGLDFCLSCHKALRFAGSHGPLQAVAHMGSRYAAAGHAGPLDLLSSECMACHDGSVGKAIECRLGRDDFKGSNGVHPVGMVYKESRMRDRKLVPLSSLDRRLVLFDGKVGCGTCHNLYSRLPKRLAKSNAGSGLCLSCHRK